MQAYTCTSQDPHNCSLCMEPDTLELCRSGMYRFLLKSSFIGFCAVSLHFSLNPLHICLFRFDMLFGGSLDRLDLRYKDTLTH